MKKSSLLNAAINPLSFALKVVLTFGLVFNLSFTAAPVLTSGRIAVFCMFLIYGSACYKLFVKFIEEFKLGFLVFFTLIPFSLCWMVFNGTDDVVMFSRALWFLIYTLMATFLYARMSEYNIRSAMSYYMVAIIIQAFFVFNTVVDPDFRDWVEHVLVMGGNVDFSEGVRFSGFTNSGAASVALQLGLGVAAALVLFSQSRSNFSRIVLLFSAIVISISTVFVGRTGLYVSLLFLLAFIPISGRSMIVPFTLIFIMGFAVAYIYSFSSGGFEVASGGANLDRTFNWAFDVFIFGESDSANSLASTLSNVRELSVSELLIGSGRVINHDGSNYSGHDSGYIHSLYSLGLPLSLLFYATILYIFLRHLRKLSGRLKYIGVMLVLLVFLLEIKEPFIFKYTLPFFVFVFLYLARKQIGVRSPL